MKARFRRFRKDSEDLPRLLHFLEVLRLQGLGEFVRLGAAYRFGYPICQLGLEIPNLYNPLDKETKKTRPFDASWVGFLSWDT